MILERKQNQPKQKNNITKDNLIIMKKPTSIPNINSDNEFDIDDVEFDNVIISKKKDIKESKKKEKKEKTEKTEKKEKKEKKVKKDKSQTITV
jgi:hypothetical protein